MKTKESLLKLIQDSTDELAMLIATEDTPKVEPWKPKEYNYGASFGNHYINTRPTEALANRAINELYSYAKLLAYRDEYCPEYVHNTEHENYCVYYDFVDECYYVESYRLVKDLGRVYFDKFTAYKLCEALNNGSYTL